ncbi:MAG: lamin tail domain-containing protein, partial [Methanothrix sp.]|nr:lamin tail domain-containing protein [Methanothrix sp.]
MRRTLTLSLALALIFLLPGTTFGNVVINEVELNPTGDESGHKAPVRAWVELYNDDKDVNIGGWGVNTSEGRSV